MTTPVTSQTDWNAILSAVAQGLTALAPIISAAVPGSAVAIDIAQKIAQGVLAAEPAAIALYNQITSGGTVTPDQLAAYITDNDAANAQLQADIAERLAFLAAKGA